MIKDSLPKFVREMKEIAELLRVSQDEVNSFLNEVEILVKQFYIASSTYSITDWEKEFGIDINTTLSIEQRRAQVIAKLNTRTPATVSNIETLVKKVLGAENVSITEHPSEYSFTIYVQTGYLVENMGIADEAVRKFRPAHLNYEFINGMIRENKKKLYFCVSSQMKVTVEGVVNTDGIYINQQRSRSAHKTYY